MTIKIPDYTSFRQPITSNNTICSKQHIQKCVSLREILPQLPPEIWKTVFDTLPVIEKLNSSRVIYEFREFYRGLALNFERYAANFQNRCVELSSYHNLSVYQYQQWTELHHLPRVTFSIYLSKNWVVWQNASEDSFKHAAFQNEDGITSKYLTYLKVNAICWLRFSLYDLKLPTGKYHMFYKMKGPCDFMRNEYKVTVKHVARRLHHDTGYIDTRQLEDLEWSWQWVPVYADKTYTRLLSVSCNFEQGDWVSEVALSSENEYWSRDICFSSIQFVCTSNRTSMQPISINED